MSSHVKIVTGLIIVGVLVILGMKFVLPMIQDKTQKATSDARSTKGTVTLALDNWVGYFPLGSQEMKKRMRRSGYILECINDGADYAERMRKIKKGEYQFAVATVDSYVLNGAVENFPATIIGVLDESSGGDAVLAWKDRVKDVDSLKREQGAKVAYTPGSPSEHLLKSMAVHFDIPSLRDRSGNWKTHTEGSEQALKKLLAKDVDVAVLWEPDVSRALEKGQGEIVKLLGTEDTEKLIVDVLLVNREFARDQPEVVKVLLSNYFRTLKYFRDNPDDLMESIVDDTDLDKKKVATMLKGVKWVNLADNNQSWFGNSSFGAIPEEGLIDTIEAVVQILRDAGDFAENPLPDKDPYRITNSQFVAELHQEGLSAGQFKKAGELKVPDGPEGSGSLERPFAQLADPQWERLREIGTLKVRPIVFQSGTSELTYNGKQELDKAVEYLRHYPNFRVVIKGHTGLSGDAKANRQLSQARADAVKRYLQVTYSINENRLRSVGYGSEQPLPRQQGEAKRAYSYRLPRVELFLASEVF